MVPRAFDRLPPAAQLRLIRHELVHAEQRRRHGRLYLPLYAMPYLRHGYEDHPLECEAGALMLPEG